MSSWVNGNLQGRLSIGQGERGPQGVPGRDGADGTNGKDGVTPNIQVGTVTTLEAGQQATIAKRGTVENPIFDFAIPKGDKGDKGERGEKGEQGIQGIPGKDGADGVTPDMSDFEKKINEQYEDIDTKVKDVDKRVQAIEENGVGGGNANIDDTTISKDTTWSSEKIEDFVHTNDDVVWSTVQGENLSVDYTKEGYLREVEIWGNTIQNEEDLSNIQHLGELYVNDEGQPILDSEGREQYKIEVESTNGKVSQLKLMNNELSSRVKFAEIGGKVKFITNSSKDITCKIFTYNKDGTPGLRGNQFVIPTNGFTAPFNLYYPCESFAIQCVDNDETLELIATIDDSINSYNDYKQHKTTLLLPCQLMNVGDISDRLYWDSDKKKYVVEKNIGFEKLCDLTVGFSVLQGYEDRLVQGFRFYPCNKPTNVLNSLKAVAIVKGLKNDMTINDEEGFSFSKPTTSYVDFRCKLTKANLNSNDLVGVNEYFNKNNFVFFYTQNPQLIETNITKEIEVLCYKDKTHLFVTGGLDGSIKAKVPLDGGQAIQSLSAKNIALNEEVNTLSLENEELKSTNDTQDELINTTMLATDEMYMMLEPLLSEVAQTLSLERSVSKMVDMYVAMVMRGLKTVEQVPARYREEVREILAQLEK